MALRTIHDARIASAEYLLRPAWVSMREHGVVQVYVQETKIESLVKMCACRPTLRKIKKMLCVCMCVCV